MATKHTDTGATTGCEAELWAMADVPGFCKSASMIEVRGYGHVLTAR